MVDVPRETRLALFPGFLRRGAIIRVEQYPFLYTGPKDKFLVLLNLQFTEDRPIYCVLTTSQTAALPFPELTLVVQPGTVGCFAVATAISCREIHPINFQFLAERYAVGRVVFVGELPAPILTQLEGLLAGSPYLAPAIAREILPPP